MRGAQAPRPSPGLPCVVCFAIFLHVCVPTGCWAALLLSAGGAGPPVHYAAPAGSHAGQTGAGGTLECITRIKKWRQAGNMQVAV